MLEWSMLVIGLDDEMKNQHAQDIQGSHFQIFMCDFKWYLAKVTRLMIHDMDTRPLLIMLISRGILVFVYVQLLMMLRMVYWCTPIGITLQRSISYTLASYGRHRLLYFLSKHMCKLQSKLLAHMQREQLLPYGVHDTYPKSFTHGKIAWASNMNPKRA